MSFEFESLKRMIIFVYSEVNILKFHFIIREKLKFSFFKGIMDTLMQFLSKFNLIMK